MKIAILGASVSAQTFNHVNKEVTGYAEVLRREHAAALGLNEIRQITYAGNRVSDGGLLRLEQVVAYAPEVCLFEPLIEDVTRGTRASDAEIKYVYRRLLAAGIVPVTLMLPHPVRRVPNSWPEYARYKAVCQALGLPVIEIDLTGVERIEEKFNGFHTHLEGAKIYAARIADGLRALGDLRALRAALPVPPVSDKGVVIQQVALPDPPPDTVVGIDLSLQATPAASTRIRLVQLQSIGPFSPVLDVTVQAAGKADPFVTEQRSVWDPYCHFARPSFVTLADFQSDGHGAMTLTLTCSAADPDYATCRRDGISWPAQTERGLKPMGPLTLISDGPLDATLGGFDHGAMKTL